MNRVFIEHFDSQVNLETTLNDALDWTGAKAMITPGTRVFIKPNLTWRLPKPGVTVSPLFLRSLVENILSLTPYVTLVESDGGQACFCAEDAFENHGLYTLEKEYGIRVINLSKEKSETISTTVCDKNVSVELPSVMLHDMDVFITVPVPKIHAMTRVSLGFKNQWGCLGDNMRVNQHPYFDVKVIAINKILKPRLCVFDGTHFLDYTGPMMGEPVPMNLVIAGDDVGAASYACCEIMQIDPISIGHHRIALKNNMFPRALDEIEFNCSPKKFVNRRFRLKRSFINYIQLAAFRNSMLNFLFYDSRYADFLHEVLWLVRHQPTVKRFLYGRYGTGEANRGDREV